MKEHRHESSWRDTPEELKWNLKIKGSPEGEDSEFGNRHFGDEYQPLSVIWGGFKVFKARAKAMYPKMHHPANLPSPKKGEIHRAFLCFYFVYQSRIIPGNESTCPSSWQDGAKLTWCLKRWFRKKKLILSNQPPPLIRIFSESSHQFPQRHPDRKIWRDLRSWNRVLRC